MTANAKAPITRASPMIQPKSPICSSIGLKSQRTTASTALTIQNTLPSLWARARSAPAYGSAGLAKRSLMGDIADVFVRAQAPL
jgi:hypothetical protein